MHQRGSDPPPPKPPRGDKGKHIVVDEPRLKRHRPHRQAMVNMGDRNVLMPQSTTTARGPGETSHSSPIAPLVPNSMFPTGPNWYPMGPLEYPMGPPSYPMGTYGYPMGTPAGHPMGPPGHPMGPPGHPMGTPAGLSMPTLELHTKPQDDHLQPVHDESDDSDTSTEVEEVEVYDDGRGIIYPCGNTLLPSTVALKAITHVLKKKYFLEFHPKWSKVSLDKKNGFLELFQTKVTWLVEDDEKVRNNFLYKMGRRLSDMLFKLQIKDQRPKWIGEVVWNQLKAHWASNTYKRFSAKAKKNRASEKGDSLHYYSSVKQALHAARLKARRSLSIPELHRATHVRKVYTYEISRKAQEGYSEVMNATQESWNPDSLDPLTPEMLALANRNRKKVIRGKNKGRLCGSRPFATFMQFGVDHVDTSEASSSQPPRPSQATTKVTEQLKQQLQTHDQIIRSLQEDIARVTGQQEKMFRFYRSMRSAGEDVIARWSEIDLDDAPY